MEEWLEAIQLAESAGLEFDETLYRDAAKDIGEMRRMIEAAMPLKKFMRER